MSKDNQEIERAQKAYQKLQHYRKSSLIERDYKAELEEALEERIEHKMNVPLR